MRRPLIFAIDALLLLLMLLPSQAKFSRKTKEQVLKTQSWYLGDFFVSLIFKDRHHPLHAQPHDGDDHHPQLEEEAELEALCLHRNQGEFFRLEAGGDCRQVSPIKSLAR